MRRPPSRIPYETVSAARTRVFDQQEHVEASHTEPQVAVQLQHVVVVVQPPASGDWIVSGACLVLFGAEKTSTSTARSIASTTFLAILSPPPNVDAAAL